MAKIVKPRAEEVQDEPEVQDTHLYKVVYRRLPESSKELASRMRTFVTFGVSEEDAVDRIWASYRGSSFQREFPKDLASAEFVLGGILKIGGN